MSSANKLKLDKKSLKNIQSILDQHLPSQYKAFIFGSRATQKSTKFSDIDLGIEGPEKLDLEKYFNLESAFENSNIPYKIDLVDFSKVTPQFRSIAKQNTLYLN